MSIPVLVAGGAGYIGSHVCKALSRQGFEPIAFDTLETGHAWAVQWGPLVAGNIGDREALEAVFAAHDPRAVINLAGYIEVGESVRNPAKYWHNNVDRMRALLDVCAERQVEAFLFSSSCAVFGTPRGPLDEDHAFHPESPYGETKLAGERLLERAAGRGLRSVSLRYFNAAGADPDGEIGEAHEPETHLVPLTIAAALGERPPLTIFGDDYDTPDGTCLRDYVHVTDVADAHVLALQSLLERRLAFGNPAAPAVPDEERASLLAALNNGDVASADGGCHVTLNLGSGTGYSVKEVVETVGRVCGRAVPHSIGARRPGDPPRLVGSIDKIRRLLGWNPGRGLEQQIEDALRWSRTPHARSTAANHQGPP
jgi:UDP-glucose-4-epimerase GalE